MSEPIRIKLTGKNAEQFNRVFSTLADVVLTGMMAVIPQDDEELIKATQQFVSDIADLTKGWVKAKIERPGLENEKIIAEIVNLFEDAKVKRAQRQKLEIENESARLDLMVKRVETALKLLGMLSNSFVRDGNEELTLILTNENLAILHADVKAMSQPASEETV
jgi:hypothetical protein